MKDAARALRIHASDNVAVALQDIAAGDPVCFGADTQVLTATEAVPFGHKIAIASIVEGGLVMKYGAPVGRTTKTIQSGDWVHTHNAESRFVRSEGHTS